jgi:hypothetical protein
MGVSTLTTARVRMMTRPAVSLHQRNAAKDETEITETCVTSSAIEMHATGSKTDVKNETVSNKNNAMRGTMTIMVPSTMNHTNNEI